MDKTSQFTVYIVPFFVLLIAWEFLYAKKLNKNIYSFKDTICDLSCGLIDQVSGVIANAFILLAYIYCYKFTFFPNLKQTSPYWYYVLLILGVDFTYYVSHYASHKINFMWANHEPHHNSPKYNYFVAVRLGPFQKFTTSAFYIVVLLLGVTPLDLMIMKGATAAYQFWIHTRLIGKLGPLELFMNTPSHHRVHHGTQPKYLDKNMAGIFIIWDRLCGTFEVEIDEPNYGIITPLKANTPLEAIFNNWKRLFSSMFIVKGLINKTRVFVDTPAWLASIVGRKQSADTKLRSLSGFEKWIIFLVFGVTGLASLYFLYNVNTSKWTTLEKTIIATILLSPLFYLSHPLKYGFESES